MGLGGVLQLLEAFDVGRIHGNPQGKAATSPAVGIVSGIRKLYMLAADHSRRPA